jgi:hypothetical protein
MLGLQQSLLQRLDGCDRHLINGPIGVDPDQQSPGVVVVEQRHRLEVVHVQTMPDRPAVVVGTALCFASIEKAFEQDGPGDVEGDDGIGFDAELYGVSVGGLGLPDRSGKAVQQVSADGGHRGLDLPAYDQPDQLVRDEIAAIEILSDLSAKPRASGDLAPEHVTRRDTGDAEVERDPSRLGALAGAGRRDQQGSEAALDGAHLRNPVSTERTTR